MPDKHEGTAIRVQDKCAWCDHALAVVTRSWEGMGSDSGRLVAANFCNGGNGCAQPGCPKNCNLLLSGNPGRAEKVLREIKQRQQVLRREEERRERATS